MHCASDDDLARPGGSPARVENGKDTSVRSKSDDLTPASGEHDGRRANVEVAACVRVKASKPFPRPGQSVESEHTVVRVTHADEGHSALIDRGSRPDSVSWTAACADAHVPSLPTGGRVHRNKTARDERAVSIGRRDAEDHLVHVSDRRGPQGSI